MPPLALYVHLPWCVRKCPYCDFNSWPAGDEAPRARYIDALLTDLELEATRAEGRALVSIFLGGGTPSLFSPAEVGRLLDGVRRNFELCNDVEITMEANPGTVECGDPAGYHAVGVNRLSIGAQSFAPAALQALGRIHSVEDIHRAADAARKAGFTNINLDLMYGLPEQDIAAAVLDIESAAELEPEHLSWYQLTLEPNTVFHARPPAGLPDDDKAWDMQQRGQERLAELGYEQYEVSAYARDARRSTHNMNYWLFGDYLAVGAGAHGKVSNAAGIWRYSKPANPKEYMERAGRDALKAELRPIAAAERLFEFMLNVLRLTDGFDEALFEARTGLSAADLRQRLRGPVDKGLITEIEPNVWRVTSLGGRFLNDLQAEFLPR